MSDHITLQQGYRPWAPSEDSEIVAVLHRFTVPLVGVLKQEGHYYLFWCIVGHAAEENAWAYASIEDDSWHHLEEAGADEFDDELRSLAADQVVAFAMANDERGIGGAVSLDPPTTFDHAFVAGMTQLRDKIVETHAEYQALRDQAHQMRLPGLLPSTVDREQLAAVLEPQ